MSDLAIKRALISVYDKTGVLELAGELSAMGVEVVSTGGTAALLQESGVQVTLVEQITGWGEMLDGRVKTLHPKIHAAILADRNNPTHVRQLTDQGIEPIDLVVVNLYPFEQTTARDDCTFDQAIEMIDIGGPTLLRAAAKNHQHVVVLCQPGQYRQLIEELKTTGKISQPVRQAFAEQVFETCARYNLSICSYLNEVQTPPDARGDAGAPATWAPILKLSDTLRYGENPHQKAGLYRCDMPCPTSPAAPEQVAGPQMSYNNHVDADAAARLLADLTVALQQGAFGALRSAAVFVKHTNPCGAAVADDPIEAYQQAYLGDPLAAMGGVLAMNATVTRDIASAVMETLDRWGRAACAGAFFVEVWAAPKFEPDAVETIQSAKPWGRRVRLLAVGDSLCRAAANQLEIKRITGGMLVQTTDDVGLNEQEWRTVSQRAPTDVELNDLRFAWLVCKHVKSNAIVVARDGVLLGAGAGQMSRVTSCRLATELAARHLADDRRCVAASDAFFPFRDGPEILFDAGATAIIQPGGSKRDDETIAACNEHNAALILTGTRHFRH